MKKYCIALLICTLFSCSENSSIDDLMVAKKHITENKLDDAAIELKNAIKKSPDLAEARFLLGKLYLETNQFEDAVQQFERALQHDYAKKQVLPLLAKSYKSIESDHALMDIVTDNVGLSLEQIAEIKLYQIQANLRLAKEPEAKLLIEEVKNLPAQSSFIELALVYESLLSKKESLAKVQVSNILRKDKTQPDALKLQAMIQLQMQDIEGALASYRTYTTTYPHDLTTSFNFARLLVSSNQTKEAESIVDNLLTLNSEHALLNQLKGMARFNDNDNENALLYLEKSLLDSTPEVGTRLAAGISAYKLKDYQKSHFHLSFIADDLPNAHPALRMLASSQLALGLSLEASETINDFGKLTIGDSGLLSSLGLSLALQGEKIKAEKVLQQFNKLTKNNVQNLPQVALLKLSLDDVSGVEDLEKLLADTDANSEVGGDSKKYTQEPIENILATTYLATNQFDKALKLATKLKTNNKNSIQGHMLAGFTYIKQQNITSARNEFETALSIEPDNIKIKLSLIDLLPNESVSEKQDIIEGLAELLKEEPNFIPLLSRYYTYNKQLGHTEKAIAFTRNSFNQFPGSMALALVLGEMYFSESQYQDVINTLLSVDTIPNKPNRYWQLLAHSYIKEKLFAKATRTYESWLEGAPSNKDAILGNILVLQAQNKLEQALELTELYITNQGNDATVGILQTGLLIKQQQFERAQKVYDNLPVEAYSLPLVKGLSGELLLHEKKYKQALPKLEALYQAKPTSRNTYLVYQSLVKLGKHNDAYDFLFQHTILNPKDTTMLMKLAALQITKNSEQAIANYLKILKVNKDNALANNNLAFVLAKQGKNHEALEYAQEAIRLEPNNSNYLDTLGRLLLDSNKNSDALEYLSKAVVNNKGKLNEEIYLNYIEALIMNNKIDFAKHELNGVEFSVGNLPRKQALSQLMN